MNRQIAFVVDAGGIPTHRHTMSGYETEANLRRSPEDAIAAAETTLSATGFRIIDRPRDGLVADSPGYRATKQNSLLAAGRIELSAAGRTLRASADLRGVEWMRRFLLWFPLLLGVGLCGIMAAIAFAVGKFGNGFPPLLVAAPLLPVLPWAVIGPLMARSVRRRAIEALDTLVANASAGTVRVD